MTVVLTDNVDHERSEGDHPAPSAIRRRYDLAVRRLLLVACISVRHFVCSPT